VLRDEKVVMDGELRNGLLESVCSGFAGGMVGHGKSDQMIEIEEGISAIPCV